MINNAIAPQISRIVPIATGLAPSGARVCAVPVVPHRVAPANTIHAPETIGVCIRSAIFVVRMDRNFSVINALYQK
jgi:hypothetical protein